MIEEDPDFSMREKQLCPVFPHCLPKRQYDVRMESGLPGKDQVNNMILKCGGTPINRSPSGAGCWYWTSTEVTENKMNQAWLISMADGSIHKAPKTNGYRARLIVEYNPYE